MSKANSRLGQMEGRVTNITDYGAFVELEAEVEGLVHVSEMSWTKKMFIPVRLFQPASKLKLWCLMSICQSAAFHWPEAMHSQPVGRSDRNLSNRHSN